MQYISNNKQNQDLHIYDGIGTELLYRSGHPPSQYTSYDDYVARMSMPNTYMGQPEITAANNLYNISIQVHFDQSSVPLPQHTQPNQLHVRFNPVNRHYDTILIPNPPPLPP